MKKLKNKHLNNLKINAWDEQTKRKYLASYMLGLQSRVIKSEFPRAKRHSSDYVSIKEILSEAKKGRANTKKVFKKIKALRAWAKRHNDKYDFRFTSFTDICKSYKNKLVSYDKEHVSEYQALKERYQRQFKANSISRPLDFSGTPLIKYDYVGIELEFYSGISRSGIIQKAERLKIKNFNIGSDGSIQCDGGFEGHEIKVLLRNDKTYLETELKKLCRLLSEIDAQVNQSCGFHVHIDARYMSDSQKTITAKRLSNALPVLSKLVPNSRRSNSYCRLGVSKRRGERYFAVNMTALSKYSTIEVRLHSGTTDFLKIFNWIQLLNIIISTKNGKPLQSIDDMIEKLALPDFLAAFYYARYKKFNADNSQASEESEISERSIDTIDNLTLDNTVNF